jgi:hypothetical protein
MSASLTGVELIDSNLPGILPRLCLNPQELNASYLKPGDRNQRTGIRRPKISEFHGHKHSRFLGILSTKTEDALFIIPKFKK